MKSGAYGAADATAQLDHAVRALEGVRSRMAAAMKTAEYWRDEYAGHGMPGLGRSCEQIRAAAEEVHDQAGDMAGTIGAQTAAVTTITDTTEPERVIATLTPVEQALGTRSAGCLAAANRCTDLAALIARNLAGGKPEWLIEQADNARSSFEQTRRHVDTATDLVQNAIRHARHAGTDGGASPMIPRDHEVDARTGTPEPTDVERAGYRTVNEESDLLSDSDKYWQKAVRNSPDTADSVDNLATFINEGWSLRPTGQHVGQPHGDYTPASGPQHALNDVFMGVAAGLAVIARGVKLIRDRRRQRKADGDDRTA